VSVKVADLELTGALEPARLPAHCRGARFLVRLHGTPLGYLDAPAEAVPDTALLRRLAVARLSREIWRAHRARRLAGVAPAEEDALCITAVVCTRDRPRQLEGCLASLSSQDYASYELLVVDNGSRDAAIGPLAERYGARHVLEPKRGLDRARNRGLLEARSAVVAFTDDDARPDRGWLTAISRAFRETGARAVTGLVVPAELDSPAQQAFEDGYGGMCKGFTPAVLSGAALYRPERFGVGCNMAFDRATLLALGGFDPALDVGTPTGGGGDLDALQRLAEAGWAIAYTPDAIVRHSHRRTGRALARQLFDNGRGYSAMLTAALLRARGRERVRVVSRYVRWIEHWHVRRIARIALRRLDFPLRLQLAELAGAPLGPIVYLLARRRR
jgi:glycosyltransferase involved in cell wall biosynthesis